MKNFNKFFRIFLLTMINKTTYKSAIVTLSTSWLLIVSIVTSLPLTEASFSHPEKAFFYNEEFLYFICILVPFIIAWKFIAEMFDASITSRVSYDTENYMNIYIKKEENLNILISMKNDYLVQCYELKKFCEKLNLKLYFLFIVHGKTFFFPPIKLLSVKCIILQVVSIINDFNSSLEHSNILEENISFQNECFSLLSAIQLVFELI